MYYIRQSIYNFLNQLGEEAKTEQRDQLEELHNNPVCGTWIKGAAV